MPIRIPALRERRDDIDDLVAYFLADFCGRNNVRPKTIDDDVVSLLKAYEWPGNVRELRNVVERMVILTPGDRIAEDAVPIEIRMPVVRVATGLHEVRDAAERERIVQALDDADWNVSAAARRLGIERTNLHKRMRALSIRRT